MTTTTQLHTPYILDAEWVEAIEEALATPTTVPFAIEPCTMAVYDLMFGRECDPTNYYRTVAECEAYLICYMDGAKAWAAKVDEVNASLGSKPVAIDYQAELDDLVEGMFETEWIRGGC